MPRVAYPTASFSTILTTTVTSSRSRQAEALERNLLFALGAEDVSTPQIASEKETQKETLISMATRDDTNSQRPTQFQALSDD